jgi:hypothetical protein
MLQAPLAPRFKVYFMGNPVHNFRALEHENEEQLS